LFVPEPFIISTDGIEKYNEMVALVRVRFAAY